MALWLGMHIANFTLLKHRKGSNIMNSKPAITDLKTILTFFYVFMLASCTGEIIGLQSQYADGVFAKSTVKGEFCTEKPGDITAPVKVNFIVDVSGSMGTSDPDDLRAQAVQAIVDKYISQKNYSFSIIAFESEIYDLTEGFTRDEVILADAILELKEDIGGTHTYDAVTVAAEAITNDLISIDSAGGRLNAKYINILLSDGMPNGAYISNEEAEEMTISAVDALMALEMMRGVDEIVLHSTYLTDEYDDYAIDFMREVAQHGNGEFLLFEDATDISFESFDYSAAKISYDLLNIVITNTNSIIRNGLDGEPVVMADSDGDGLTDDEETELATHLEETDSDKDGFSDFIEVYRGTNPLKKDLGCDDISLDSDGDGITDCEENLLFSDPTYFDTDNDNFIDILEFIHGTDPLFADQYDDSDGDGRANGAEIKLHTNPTIDDSELFESKGYEYKVELKDRMEDGTYCYHIEVLNIPLTPTQRCRIDGSCFNKLKAYIIQKPQDHTVDSNLLTIGEYDAKIYMNSPPDPEEEAAYTKINLSDFEFVTLKN